ncbi:MAG TPA: 50S ribosomal protein L11 methyltransferase [Ilumatobacter sp.]|nr:50S ribosomal protein L11 methyltransferase [Ilumatobacter sp.]
MARVVELRVPAAEAELAADRLWTAGAQAVEELGGRGGTVALRSVLSDDDAVSRTRLGELPAGWELGFVDQPDAPSEAWRDHAVPIHVSPTLVVRPAWLAPLATTPGVEQVAIEPAGAFGLGDHPTTRLAAAAAERLTRAGVSVLDVGCGTGVLAVIAALRGAAPVVAIDVAEAALEATWANAARNGVERAVDVSTTPLAEVDGAFDVVFANILAPTLVALADDLLRVLAPDGTLVISGVLAGAYDHVVAALHPLAVVRTDVADGWAAVELRR